MSETTSVREMAGAMTPEVDKTSRALGACEAGAGKAAWKSLIRTFENRLAAAVGPLRLGSMTLAQFADEANRVMLGVVEELRVKIIDALVESDAPLAFRNTKDAVMAKGVPLGRGTFTIQKGADYTADDDWMREYVLDALRKRRCELLYHPRPSGAQSREPAMPKPRRDEKLYVVSHNGDLILHARAGDKARRLRSGQVFAAQPSQVEISVGCGEVELVKPAAKGTGNTKGA